MFRNRTNSNFSELLKKLQIKWVVNEHNEQIEKSRTCLLLYVKVQFWEM